MINFLLQLTAITLFYAAMPVVLIMAGIPPALAIWLWFTAIAYGWFRRTLPTVFLSLALAAVLWLSTSAAAVVLVVLGIGWFLVPLIAYWPAVVLLCASRPIPWRSYRKYPTTPA